ncbi:MULTISPECIES: helix-turn-helix domain-containing protein [unclassified Rathayibacter]|jgi:transcriptional regulator with XRE-family HTH domain|uniref:helix-turn-helix domain-containing protein n=1 Tax=unclassified Rathayibacter TaxID=2609250 RepID=UPI000CE8DC5A|nr:MULTISPECIES: XRE family transcriptional regulator [unclassified Rathayibacter]PPF23785.1 XRE family transcriptional regulator [Rathayibacter sp. AY1F2]PPH40879.1 XRE family transcriptional regulator [Rathayibacter sp. AY1F7]
MGTSSELLAVAIGERVRRARQARKWTLDRLAADAEVSRRQLVKVEQGETNPSIATLVALSDALGIAVSELVEAPSSHLVKVTRDGQAAQLWTGKNGGRGLLVATTRPPDLVELWEWELAPGDRHVSTAHTRGTRELLHVHEGTVALTVGEDEFQLSPGDAITFPGDSPHIYAHAGDSTARFSLSVYEPNAGAGDTTQRPSPKAASCDDDPSDTGI